MVSLLRPTRASRKAVIFGRCNPLEPTASKCGGCGGVAHQRTIGVTRAFACVQNTSALGDVRLHVNFSKLVRSGITDEACDIVARPVASGRHQLSDVVLRKFVDGVPEQVKNELTAVLPAHNIHFNSLFKPSEDLRNMEISV